MAVVHFDGLARVAPSVRGVDPEAIRAFTDAVALEGMELHSFMFWKSGAVIAEGWWAPYAADIRHMMHSAVKSFVATGIGLAVDRGLLALDTPVVSFFPEHVPENASPLLAQMTLRHLLTMTSGHASGISGGEWRRVKTSWIAAFLREPMVRPPGEHFVYCSGCSYMLAAILQKATGQRAYDWMEPRLFAPLGIQDLAWDVGPDGVNTGGNGIRAKTSDLLKLVVLHLQGGEWEGRQLLSRGWVEAATGMQVADVALGVFDGKRYASADDPQAADLDRREGYGFQWWRGPDNTFSANGLFGQYAIVFPDHDAAFVFTGGLAAGEKTVHRLIWEHLLPAMRAGAVPSSQATVADEALARHLAQCELPLAHDLHIPTLRANFSVRYAIEPNEDDVREIAIDSAGGLCRLTLTDARGVHEISASFTGWHDSQTTMTGWKLHHSYQPDQIRVFARAHWCGTDELVFDWSFIETAFRDRVVCRIDGDRLNVTRRVNTNSTETELALISGRRIADDAPVHCVGAD